MTASPTPGSPEAVAQGCTCPAIDNHHGEGFLVDHVRCFVIDCGCPLHGTAQKVTEHA